MDPEIDTPPDDRTCKVKFKDIITTLAMKMQCGLGKCDPRQHRFDLLCKNGPVFTPEQLKVIAGRVLIAS